MPDKQGVLLRAGLARTEGTDWNLACEELGTEGTDLDHIERLAQKMRASQAQAPSVEYEQPAESGEQLDPALRLREVGLPTPQAEIEAAQSIEHDQELGVSR